jgi:hypothetical protein
MIASWSVAIRIVVISTNPHVIAITRLVRRVAGTDVAAVTPGRGDADLGSAANQPAGRIRDPRRPRRKIASTRPAARRLAIASRSPPIVAVTAHLRRETGRLVTPGGRVAGTETQPVRCPRGDLHAVDAARARCKARGDRRDGHRARRNLGDHRGSRNRKFVRKPHLDVVALHTIVVDKDC